MLYELGCAADAGEGTGVAAGLAPVEEVAAPRRCCRDDAEEASVGAGRAGVAVVAALDCHYCTVFLFSFGKSVYITGRTG